MPCMLLCLYFGSNVRYCDVGKCIESCGFHVVNLYHVMIPEHQKVICILGDWLFEIRNTILISEMPFDLSI